MKTKILTAIIVLNISFAYSQNQEVIPPSPNSSALGKYVDNPVSLYTGTPQIDIPLYEIKTNDFTLPISLSYHAGGIKVGERASNIGLGWALNAGGVITRVIKDIPDDCTGTDCVIDPINNPIKKYGQFYREDRPSNIDIHNIRNIDIIDAYNQDATDYMYSLENVFASFYDVTLGSPKSYTKVGDSEPDIFYFNFCGKTGKFVFDVYSSTSRVIRFLPHQDFKIDYTLDGNGRISEFEIIDEEGVVYTFSEVETSFSMVFSRSTTPTIVYTDGEDEFTGHPQYRTETTYNSSWYLTSITTPNNNTFSFEYEEEYSILFDPGSSQTVRFQMDDFESYNPNIDDDFKVIDESSTRITGKRLSYIENENLSIAFESDHIREDLCFMFNPDGIKSKAITGLTIYSKPPSGGVKRIKKYNFTQDYFESNSVDNSSIEHFYGICQDARDMDFYHKRLRLRNVQEYGGSDADVLPSTSFEYKYDGFPGYTALELPHRFSYQQDLWGYYNGASENALSIIPKLYVYHDMFSDSRRYSVYKRNNHTGQEHILPGANRLPSESHMDIGMLTKINYPTGGYTEYEYQPHVFKDVNEEFSGGGVRIKKITKHDGIDESNDIVYNYSYLDSDGSSTGNLISMPIFAVFAGTGKARNADGTYFYRSLDGSQTCYRYNTTRFSHPQAPLGNTKGSTIGYRKVTEYISGNGRTEYEYSMPAIWYQDNDSPGADCSEVEHGTCDNLYTATTVYNLFPGSTSRTSNYDLSMTPATINSFPFPENPNYDWNRGHLLSKKIYNESNSIVGSESFDYAIWHPNSGAHKVYGMKFGQYCAKILPEQEYNNDDAWHVAKYEILTGKAKVLTSKTVTDYSIDGSSISKTTEYSYDGEMHKNITKITEEMSTGDKLVKKFVYSGDFNCDCDEGSSATNDLRLQNRVNIPLEVSEYIKKGSTEYLRGSVLTKYGFINNKPYPNKQFKVETNTLLTDFKNILYNIDPSEPECSDACISVDEDDRYSEKVHFKEYDENGNILEIEDKTTGLTTSYIWGYNNQYPVVKAVSTSYSELQTILGATLTYINRGYIPWDVHESEEDYALTDSDIRNELGILRTSLPDAWVTIYTYKPLVGITSETDINGRTTYYEYDNFNRLKLIKDHDGNILKQYEYHYKNQ